MNKIIFNILYRFLFLDEKEIFKKQAEYITNEINNYFKRVSKWLPLQQ